MDPIALLGYSIPLVPESLFERHNAAAEIDGPDRRMYDDVMPIINQSNGLVCLIRLAPDFIQGEGLMNLGLRNICLSLPPLTADRGRCGEENRNPKDVQSFDVIVWKKVFLMNE